MGDELRFDGKVVLITGAGAGLGRSHALLFAKRGAKVVVNDLGGSATGEGKSAKAADAVVAEIKAAGGEAVANYDSVEDGEKIVKTAIDAFGRIDVVVNNAGILRDTSFPKMTWNDWELIFKVHVNGAYKVTAAAWPYLRDQGYGRVLFTTSAAGLYGNFGQANYAAAKLGLVGFAKTLALEGEKRNIRVNAIAPIAGSRLTETVLPKDLVDALKPEFVSPLVAWLAHDSCQENGGLFEVGGGFYGKLRWERTEGKTFKLGREITPEALSANWEQITDFAHTTHPTNITESMQPIVANLGSKSLGGNEFIDVDQALGYEIDDLEASWDERDAAIYALSVGAGRNPTDTTDLRNVYERHGDGFWVLPTFGVVPALNTFFQMASEGKTVPGMNYGFDRILHGEQYTEVLRPLPPKAKVKLKSKISEIWDKGKHAVVVTHLDTYDAETGELLVKNDISALVRGAGGWGGERGPSADVNVAPDRAPDAVVEEKTTEGQALLYRLNGDWNPLHVDPEFATMFGFERPILHGLATFGHVGRAVINAFRKGDPRTFKSIKVRFADPVMPGETLKIEMWKENDLRVLVRASVKERNKVVVSNAAVEFYPEIPRPQAAKPKAEAKPTAAATAAPAAVGTTDIFGAIKSYVAEHPELVKSVGNVYQFKLKSPESTWVIDLKNGAGEVKAGLADKADCTLELTDADWLAMSSGQADPQKLFMTGKLKITGNVMASQKLTFLQKLDRSALGKSGGAAAPAAAAAPAQVGTPEIFGGIKAWVGKHPELIKSVGNVYQFKLKSPESAWVIDLKNGAGEVKAGVADKADCTLELTDADWLAMSSGGADPQKLFMTGKLKITGNVMASQKLEFLKKIDKSEVMAAAPAAAPAAQASSSAQAPAEAVGPKVLAKLKERVAKNPALAKEVGATIQVKITSPELAFVLDFANGTEVKEGTAKDASTTLRLSDEALEALAKGEATLQSLFQRGQARIDGDVLVAHRLGVFKQLL